jgi:hypothetical protein
MPKNPAGRNRAGKHQATAPEASRFTKLLYRPFGLLSGMLGGLIASLVFRQGWKHATPYGQEQEDPPKALSTAYSLKEILIVSVIQGAIFALVKTLVDRGGARVFERLVGKWPGD